MEEIMLCMGESRDRMFRIIRGVSVPWGLVDVWDASLPPRYTVHFRLRRRDDKQSSHLRLIRAKSRK